MSRVARVAESRYAHLFIDNYGADFFDDPFLAYDEIARLIAAYERSAELNGESTSRAPLFFLFVHFKVNPPRL